MSTPIAPIDPFENGTQHLYLYASGHYVQGNVWDDLRTILGYSSGLSPADVQDKDILHLLLGEVEKVFARKEHGLREFILRLGEYLFSPQTPEQGEALIHLCLTELALTQDDGCRIVMPLGNPDPAILPISPRRERTGRDLAPPSLQEKPRSRARPSSLE